ncbi:glycine cleavage system aminomethyltransferase GcvT [Flavobacteriaceae bacterium]|nr:glycine cleavage system aminomethyltransferase GcvT [Flavobacteriaceae bacterium]
MKQLSLHQHHIDLGAKTGPFAGFEMPLTYQGVKAEHLCVREHVGVFDVSHMGEFMVSGHAAKALLQHTTSNNVAALGIGDAQYAYMPNTNGGVVDDLLVYRLGEEKYMLVVNASNLAKDWDWLTAQNRDFGATLENKSDAYALLAVQGPKAHALMKRLSAVDTATQKSFSVVETTVAAAEHVYVATTGYTGAGGVELYVPVAQATTVWEALLSEGAAFDIQPIGLAARDTLRLEMGYCLYGHELSDTTSPIAARLAWCTDFNKSFVGDAHIKKDKAEGTAQTRVGFSMIDRGIPRQGYALVTADGSPIGEVTSGTSSPSLKLGIGMGYIDKAYAKIGTEIYVRIREKNVKACISRLPFIS